MFLAHLEKNAHWAHLGLFGKFNILSLTKSNNAQLMSAIVDSHITMVNFFCAFGFIFIWSFQQLIAIELNRSNMNV